MITKKLSILIVVLSLLVFSTTSYADSAIGKGSKEVNIQGSLAYEQYRPQKINGEDADDKGNDNLSVLGQFGGGYFVTDWIQLGGAFVTTSSIGKNLESKSETSESSYGLDFNPKFHFYKKGQTLVPYIGPQIGGLYISMTRTSNDGDKSSASATAFAYGAFAGVKVFFQENASFNAEYNFKTTSYTIDFGDNMEYEYDLNTHRVNLGFSLYFGS